MNKAVLVILAASALLVGGGFVVGMAIGAKNPSEKLSEAKERITELKVNLAKAKKKLGDRESDQPQAMKRMDELEANLSRARKRIAELERDLAAAKRQTRTERMASPAFSTNAAECVVTVNGKDGGDIIDSLKSQLSHEEFSQVTNAMTQLRARLAEKAKGRMEYLASVNTDGMSDDERKNHARFLKLMERREAIAAKMKGGIPDVESIQKMAELEIEMAPVAKKARAALVGQVARELGYQGDDAEVVRDTVNTIFDCTSSGGLGGLGDIIESAGGAPGMSVSPGVKVETHVIGL